MSVGERALCPILVGRDEELGTLEDALLAGCRGDGRVVVLAGDAGVGKTRLATELSRRAGLLHATVMTGGCSETDIGVPYLPFLEAIGNWLPDADAGDLRARLGAAAPALGHLFPQFAERAMPADPTGEAQARLRLFEAVLALVRVAAEEHGLLLVLEDLHWADASTRELLDYMTRRLRGVAALVLATYRRDEMHRKHPLQSIVQGWRRSGQAQIVELDPLPADGVAAMVGAIFSGDEVSAEFRDFMHGRTDGNPFVLEEMLKEAIDRGDVYRTETGWERKTLAEIGIPRSVADSILARVERLDPEHAELVRAASVLGAAFAYDTLVALTGLAEDTVQRGLEACVRQQLIVEDDVAGYRFRHALTREALYEDVILPRRRTLHARTAEVLASDPASSPAELSHHLLAAGRFDEAVPMCLAAAEQATARLGWGEAAALYGRALAHLHDPHERAVVTCRLGEAQMVASDVTTASRYLQEGIEALEQHGDALTAARYRLVLGRAHWIGRRPDLARAEYERAVAVLEAAGPSSDLAVGYVRLSGLHAFDFENADSRRLAEHAIEIAEQAAADLPRVWAYGFLGVALTSQLDEDGGYRWLDRSLEEATAAGFYDVAANTLFNSIDIRSSRGRVLECPALLERWRQLPPTPLGRLSRMLQLGAMESRMGNLTGAERALLAAIEATGQGWPVWLGWAQRELSRVYLHELRIDEARPLVPAAAHEPERQEVASGIVVRILLARATGDSSAGLHEARIAVRERRWIAREGDLVLAAVQVLCAAGATDEARQLVAESTITDRNTEYPWISAAHGCIALASGNASSALVLLSEAADAIATLGYRLDELSTRLWLARARSVMGDPDGASNDLSALSAGARAAGSALLEREAYETAEQLGLPVERLGDPETDTSATLDIAPSERLVTVMFADVRGYTAMTRREAPADMAERMTAFYRWARREIERNRGLVDGYAGDAVMASFNVSEESLDHCASALDAAIALQAKATVAGLPVGVGIAVGPAVVGRLTGGDNLNVIGEATNLAARLQAQAQPGEILLSEEAFRRVRSRLEAAGSTPEERTLELKGFDAPITAFLIRST